MFAASIPSLGQVPRSEYQVGSITDITVHQSDVDSRNLDMASYDVSVQVGETIYTCLFTPPPGTYGAAYMAGTSLLVSVGTNTITFNDLLGRSSEVPIMSRRQLPPSNDVDLIGKPDQYYSTKLRHLTASLNLTTDQQSKLKHILEQETGELAEIRNNPVLSTDDFVRRVGAIVRESDNSLKPFLSPAQWETLQNLRKQQKRMLKQIARNEEKAQTGKADH